jgi:hypothetical protein
MRPFLSGFLQNQGEDDAFAWGGLLEHAGPRSAAWP